MPKLGERRRGRDIGIKVFGNMFVWHACVGCGKERWATLTGGKPRHIKCRSCGCKRSLPIPQGTLVNPQAGDVRRALEIGKKGKGRYTWIHCPTCGNGRWVSPYRSSPSNKCQLCAVRSSKSWKGGRVRHVNGYMYVFVSIDDFFFPMSHSSSRPTGGYILEHRLVMAKHLGRCLQKWEMVHHKNGIRDDNRLENLQIVMNGSHMGIVQCPHCGKKFKMK